MPYAVVQGNCGWAKEVTATDGVALRVAGPEVLSGTCR